MEDKGIKQKQNEKSAYPNSSWPISKRYVSKDAKNKPTKTSPQFEVKQIPR